MMTIATESARQAPPAEKKPYHKPRRPNPSRRRHLRTLGAQSRYHAEVLRRRNARAAHNGRLALEAADARALQVEEQK